MAKLVVQLSGGRFHEYELSTFTRLGRHPDQDVQVLDPLVSKEHLVFEQLAGDWYLRDLGSRNGAWVNGERVTGRLRLYSNDRIKVGTTHIVFILQTPKAVGDLTVAIHNEVSSSIEGELYPESPEAFLPVELIPNMEALKRDYEKLRLAAQLHRELSLDVRLETLLERVIEQVFALFRADRGVILLADEEGGGLKPVAMRVRGGEVETPIQLSQTIINKVLSERAGVLTRDASRDNRFSEAASVIMQGIRSTMCVPLLSRDAAVMGLIHLDSREISHVFTEKDLGMLQTVAQQAAIAIENSRLVARIEQEAVLRQKLEKTLSPNLVEKVVKGELEIEKGGSLRELQVLFVDIRSFTQLTESLPPQAVLGLLNEVFELLLEQVFYFEGTLDKFIGDGLMAMWGAPVAVEHGADKAIQCALEMQRAVARLNRQRVAQGKSPVTVGVGIASGQAVVGYTGSSRTMSYTAIGPTVNIASRLCAVAKPGEILICEMVAKLANPAVLKAGQATTLEPIALRGISQRVPARSLRAH